MKITPELVKHFNLVHTGGVYYGAFAKDGTDHAAIVVAIYNEKVHYFSITSSKNFIEARRYFDSEAVVELKPEETKLFFPENPKQDWIYCGSANWQTKFLDDFVNEVANETIKVLK